MAHVIERFTVCTSVWLSPPASRMNKTCFLYCQLHGFSVYLVFLAVITPNLHTLISPLQYPQLLLFSASTCQIKASSHCSTFQATFLLSSRSVRVCKLSEVWPTRQTTGSSTFFREAIVWVFSPSNKLP